MDCDEKSPTTNFNLLQEDVELLLNVVDKYVKVVMIKSCSYFGFIHSIDPATYSIILSVPQEDNSFKTIIIPGHAILDVTEEKIPTNVQPPQRIPSQSASKEDIAKRKNKLLSWFKSNLLPVSELDDKIIIGDVSVLPPYNMSDVCTNNLIVSLQIKKIMECMPND